MDGGGAALKEVTLGQGHSEPEVVLKTETFFFFEGVLVLAFLFVCF